MKRKPPTHVQSVRFTKEELALLRIQADLENVSVGELIRRKASIRVSKPETPCLCTPEVRERSVRQWAAGGILGAYPFQLPVNTFKVHFGDCMRTDELLSTRLEEAK